MSSLRRLNPISIPAAMLVLLAALALTAGMITLTRAIIDARLNDHIPTDLIPTGWTVTQKNPWFMAHPPTWTVQASENGINFIKPGTASPIVRVENRTEERDARIAALDASDYTKRDSYYFAGHPAVRYTFPDDKRVHLIAYQTSLYEITTFERSQDIDIVLATFAFLR